MDNLKKYHGKPLRGRLVPGDHHDVTTQTEATAIVSSHEDVPFSQERRRPSTSPSVSAEVPTLLFSPGRKQGCRGSCKHMTWHTTWYVGHAVPSSAEKHEKDSEEDQNSRASEIVEEVSCRWLKLQRCTGK